MSYPIFLNLQQKQAPHLKQMQKLIMMPQMQQAISLLQMPLMELSSAVEEEMEQNPLLEYMPESDREGMENLATEPIEDKDFTPEKEIAFDERNFEILKQLDEDFRDHFAESGNYYMKRARDEEKLKTFKESVICSEETLFEHLMQQAQETFSDKIELAMAEQLIGNFDANGFLETSLKEIALLNNFNEITLSKVLKEIQTFDPCGVGAANLQESLLLQMEQHGKKGSLAYQIIKDYYDDLLHNHLPYIQKNSGYSFEKIENAIKEIAKLDCHPGMWYSKQPVQYVTADVILRQEDEELIAEVNSDSMPSLRINSSYMRMLDDDTLTKETKDFIKQKIMSARWLMRNLYERNETLLRIARSLAKSQRKFFIHPQGKLVPMTMKMLAEELELHESTIARAVSNKYIETPRGLLPLRSFFTTAYVNEKGEDISAETVRDALKDIIHDENKNKPLSDEALSKALDQKGIKCARRTIAKYRAELNIGNAQQRKKF